MKPSLRAHWVILFASFLIGVRDGAAEALFKMRSVDPIFLVFMVGLVSQAVGLVLLKPNLQLMVGNLRQSFRPLLALNITSFFSVACCFLAIRTSLGAGLASFGVDTLSPLVTLAVGLLILKEPLLRKDWISTALGLAGLALLSLPRLNELRLQDDAWLGLGLVILASLGNGLSISQFSLLQRQGLTRMEIFFYRYTLQNAVIALYMTFVRPDLWQGREIFTTLPIALFGATLPFFLLLVGLKDLPVKFVSLYMFLGTVVTYAISSYLGYTSPLVSDPAAIGLVLLAVIYPDFLDRFRVRFFTRHPPQDLAVSRSRRHSPARPATVRKRQRTG